MLVIKLTKVGRKNASDFRLIVTEKRTPPRSGKYIEILGDYNPRQERINIKKERVNYWISKGAQPTATVHNLLVKKGIISGAKIPVHKKSKKTGEAGKAAQPEQKGVVKVETHDAQEKKEETPK